VFPSFYQCDRPRFWPFTLAALVKPDLWITLRREWRWSAPAVLVTVAASRHSA
jgi:hypothetical protein